MPNELMPCPFCGDVGAEVGETAAPNSRGGCKRAAYCNLCFCEGPPMDTEAEAEAAWNRRPSAISPSKEAEGTDGVQEVPRG